MLKENKFLDLMRKITRDLRPESISIRLNGPTVTRVVKGFFVIRERPFLFPMNCEMAIFFLVRRDLVTEP